MKNKSKLLEKEIDGKKIAENVGWSMKNKDIFKKDFMGNNKKILIIPPNGLGDCLRSIHIVFKIKKKYPRNKIDFLVNKNNGFSNLFKKYSFIDEIIQYEMKSYSIKSYCNFFLSKFIPTIYKINKRNYDYIMTFNPNPLRRLICLLSKCNNKIIKRNFNEHLARAPNAMLEDFEEFDQEITESLKITPAINERKILDKFKLKKKKYILLNFFSKDPAKEFKKINILINDLKENKAYILVLVGKSKDNIKRKGVMDLVNKTSLEEVMVLIKNSKVFVTIDGGLLHLSTLLKVPTFALCTVLNSEYVKPINSNHFFKAFNSEGMNNSSPLMVNKNLKNESLAEKISEKDLVKDINKFLNLKNE